MCKIKALLPCSMLMKIVWSTVRELERTADKIRSSLVCIMEVVQCVNHSTSSLENRDSVHFFVQMTEVVYAQISYILHDCT